MVKLIALSIMFLVSSFVLACPTVTISSTDASCYLASDGSATVTSVGANGPFNITWSTGQVNANVPSGSSVVANFLPAGIYTVYVVDQLGCSSVNLVVIDEPTVVTGAIASSDNLCHGGSLGTLNLTPVGGTGPYTYLWSNSSTNEDQTGLSAGNYSVNITDSRGCGSATLSATINEPNSAVSSVIVGQNVSCNAGVDGSVDLNPFGGTPPYVFNWNGGSYFTEDLSGLTSGNYSVTITDNNGCVASNTITVSQPSAITSSVQTANVSCFNGANGSIDLTVAGGTGPYSYLWSNTSSVIANSQDLLNVEADNYSVAISDNNNCAASLNTIITQPTQLQTSITSNNVSCYGLSDGNIDLFAQGGTPPYSFQWSNSVGVVGNSEDFLNIPAENYNVLLTDLNGCTITDGVEITQPNAPIQLTNLKQDVLCYGFNTGWIDLNIAGGTTPYVISWSNSATTEDIVDLFSNTYSVTVVDFNGCSENLSVNIIQPVAPLMNSFAITNVDCFDNLTGNVITNMTGGTSPYNFSWNNSTFSLSASTSGLTAIASDTYYLEVIDDHNCIYLDTAVVTQPDDLIYQFSGVDILCHGDSTGIIDLEVIGGVAPYFYQWSNASVAQDQFNVPSGTYAVEIVDANFCGKTDSIELIQPLAPLFGYYYLTEPTCFGGANGKIDYNVTGGTPVYNYLWSNTDVVSNIVELSSGYYAVYVTDAHDCVLQDTIFLDQPEEITISANVKPVTCFEDQDGAINLVVSGGSPLYQFEWANSTFVLNQNSDTIFNLPGDSYSVIVNDQFGCENSATFNLYEPSLLEADLDIKQITCEGADDGSIEAIVQGGNPGGYVFVWSNGEIGSFIDNLAPAIYVVDVYDTKNCHVTKSAEIVNPEPIVFGANITEVSCIDQIDGVIEVEATGGSGGFSYEWSNGIFEPLNEDLLGGNYTVTATDALLCTKDSTFFVPTNPIVCIEPPTVFTPQGDGINDTWFIENIDIYPEAQVVIFDQWGVEVYETNGVYEEWRGTYNGSSLPTGTYYYIITLQQGGAVFTGPVTILR